MSMYKLDKKARTFYTKYYQGLVGGTITKAGIKTEDDEGESWPYFILTLSDGTKHEIEISRDEEGNGAGFLFGLPEVK